MSPLHRIFSVLPSTLLIALLTTACTTISPPPQYTLKPADEAAANWNRGRGSIVKNLAGVEIEVTPPPENFTQDIPCYVRISNRGDDTLTVVPAQFSYLMSYRLDTITPGTIARAYNPEDMIEHYELAMNEETSSYDTQRNVDGVVSIVSGVLDLISIFTDSDEEKERKRCESHHRREDEAAGRDAAERSHELTMNSLYASQRFWTNKALRRTTVFPGEYIDGIVVFPIQVGAQLIDIRYATDADTASFRFRVEQTR